MFQKAARFSLKVYFIYLVVAVPVATVIEILKWADRTSDFAGMVIRAFIGSLYYLGLYGLIVLPFFFLIVMAYLKFKK